MIINCKNYNRIARIVCILLVIIAFGGSFSGQDKLHPFYGISSEENESGSIKSSGGVVEPVAITVRNSLVKTWAGSLKFSKARYCGYKRTVARLIYVGSIATLFLAYLFLKNCITSRVCGIVKQRLSIIIYIHNKDGRKGHILSCIF